MKAFGNFLVRGTTATVAAATTADSFATEKTAATPVKPSARITLEPWSALRLPAANADQTQKLPLQTSTNPMQGRIVQR